MLGYLPSPYPDELLYSIVARYRTYLGAAGFAVTDGFFGRKAKAIVDLPHCLGYFAKTSYALWTMSPEEIIDAYTLFPYYAYYIDHPRSEKAKQAHISSNGQIVFPSLGISASTIKTPHFLRYCPRCFSEDLATIGETFWRRTHQLPGVLVCTRHEEVLVDSNALYRPTSFDFADATESIQTCRPTEPEPLSASDIEKSILVAEFCEKLLYRKDISECVDDYRRSALYAGFNYGSDDVSNKNLTQAFVNFYGTSFLELIGSNIDQENKNNWVRKFFRKSSNGYHPVQHALVACFLAAVPKDEIALHPFGQGPWKCPNPYADHEEEKPIHKIKIRLRNGVPVASVKCSCGFNFSFRIVSRSDPSLPIVHTKCGMGPTWIAKAKEMKSTGMSNNAIAKELGIDFKTVENLLRDKSYALLFP